MLFILDRAPARQLPVMGRRISPSSVAALIAANKTTNRIDLDCKAIQALMTARYPDLITNKIVFSDILSSMEDKKDTCMLFVQVGNMVTGEFNGFSTLDLIANRDCELLADDLPAGMGVKFYLMFFEGFDEQHLSEYPATATTYNSLFEDVACAFAPGYEIK